MAAQRAAAGGGEAGGVVDARSASGDKPLTEQNRRLAAPVAGSTAFRVQGKLEGNLEDSWKEFRKESWKES